MFLANPCYHANMTTKPTRSPNRKRQVTDDGRITVSGKASNGEGSCYPVWRTASDGEQVSAGWKASQRVGDQRITAAGKTRAAALERLAVKVRAAVDLRTSAPDRGMTIGRLAKLWLAENARAALRETSMTTTTNDIARFAPINAILVAKLTTAQVRAWQASMLDSYEVSTVKRTRTVLAQVIDRAVEDGYRTDNPVRQVRAPKTEKSNAAKYVLSADEITRLLKETDQQRYGVVVGILFSEGWRIGEALGLAWQDIDMDAGTAYVVRQVVDVKGKGLRFDHTKSVGAEGLHHLSPSTIERLRRHRATQSAERLAAGSAWQEQRHEGREIDLVVTTHVGGIVRRQTVDSMLRNAGATVGLNRKRLGTHVGRRSVITILRHGGVATEDIADLVGHATAAQTETYTVGRGAHPKVVSEVRDRLLGGNWPS